MTLFLSCITLLCVLGISLGQVLFKKAALSIPTAATLAWIWVLRHAPLHLAYPFMGLAFLIVPCLGWWFLGEPLRLHTLLGGALILAGITVTAYTT